MTSITNNPPPKGWPRLSNSVAVANAAAAIDWYCKAFGFEIRLRVEGDHGRIEHAELMLGDGMIMLGDLAVDKGRAWYQPPSKNGGVCTQSIMAFVDNVDEHCARARAAGAKIGKEPTDTDYGDDYWTDRSYEAIDPDGHHWWFTQRIKG